MLDRISKPHPREALERVLSRRKESTCDQLRREIDGRIDGQIEADCYSAIDRMFDHFGEQRGGNLIDYYLTFKGISR